MVEHRPLETFLIYFSVIITKQLGELDTSGKAELFNSLTEDASLGMVLVSSRLVEICHQSDIN